MPPHAPHTSPESSQLQFYPVQYHAEFGYLVPAIGLRRRAALVGKGLICGIFVGAIATVVLSPGRDAPLRSAFSMQTQAAVGDAPSSAPVPYVASTLAVPRAVRIAASPVIAPPPAAAPTLTASPPVEAVAVAPTQQKAKPKPKKKVARQPPRDRSPRSAEDDPRRAYATPGRRSAEPYGGGLQDRQPFGFFR